MTHRSSQLALLLFLGASLAACGGGAEPTRQPGEAAALPSAAEPAATGDGVDAPAVAATCATLLPDDELANPALLGVAPPEPDERGYPGAVDCTWTFTRPGAASEDFLQVLVNANPDNATIWQAMAGAEADGESGEPIPIAGIGDASYTWVGQGDYRKLYVRRGEDTLIVRGPQSLLVFANESSMIDLADRLFGRF
jgi:hypothetical protein